MKIFLHQNLCHENFRDENKPGTRARSKQHMSLNSTAPVTLLHTEGTPLAVYNRGPGTRLGCFDQ